MACLAFSRSEKKIIDESPLAEIVGNMINAPVRFYMDQMFYKPAGLIAPSAWHQDTCYYNIDGHQLVRAWICADRAPRSVSIEVIRGSHLWNATYRHPSGWIPKKNPEGARALEKTLLRARCLSGKRSSRSFYLL